MGRRGVRGGGEGLNHGGCGSRILPGAAKVESSAMRTWLLRQTGCKMHDLLRSRAQFLGGREIFIEDVEALVEAAFSSLSSSSITLRHLSVTSSSVDLPAIIAEQLAPMHVKSVREVPEYEIDPKELDFTNSSVITKGTFQIATWRGIQVAVKKLSEELLIDEDKVRAFRDELALLQQIRHPNVVQFLGAVTQSSPMMIVTEYLPKGDLRAFLKRKGALEPAKAVRFALDIARGMNYLHEHRPEAIIHRDLEPSNILRDDTGHLKVADFGISKLLNVAKTVKEDRPLTCQDTSCRYVAPEVFCNEEYDTKVDVFSFSLILQEMIEGRPPFSNKRDEEVPKVYAHKERPPFRASQKLYSHGLKELIESCWSENPANRPSFREIIDWLSSIQSKIACRRRWKVIPLKCFHNFEAIWKKDHSRSSSRSSRSSHSNF